MDGTLKAKRWHFDNPDLSVFPAFAVVCVAFLTTPYIFPPPPFRFFPPLFSAPPDAPPAEVAAALSQRVTEPLLNAELGARRMCGVCIGVTAAVVLHVSALVVLSPLHHVGQPAYVGCNVDKNGKGCHATAQKPKALALHT